MKDYNDHDDVRRSEEAKEALRAGAAGGGDALDALLAHVGEFGRYQKLLFLGMMPFGFFFAFVYFVQMFIAATPQHHWCRVPELAHLEPELRRNITAPGAAAGAPWERCRMFAANWSAEGAARRPPPPGSPTLPCAHGWDYMLDDIPYHTVVSERDWVCEKAGYVPAAQTVFFAGSILGGVLFGWAADRFGRVPALVGANMIGCVGGIATIFTTGFWDFVFCRFLVGMSYDNAFMMMYILVLEYVGARQRTLVANMSIALYFGGGCLALPWLALLAADWRRLLWLTSLPMLLALLAPFFVPESARWLLTRGRVDRAVHVLRRFERVNGTKIPDEALEDFLVSYRRTKPSNETMMTLLRSAPLRSTMLIMVGVYMACALVFDGLVRMSESLGLDFFLTFTLTSATEIPSITLLALLLDRWGRRTLTCGPMAISAILIFAAMFVPKGATQTGLAVMARFCINMSYNAVIQWGAELLPTGARALASSALHISGYVATVLSPFVVYSERAWAALPLAVLGAAAGAAAGAALLLPETRGRAMPQAVADAERLVRDHSLCGKPERDDAEEAQWQDKPPAAPAPAAAAPAAPAASAAPAPAAPAPTHT